MIGELPLVGTALIGLAVFCGWLLAPLRLAGLGLAKRR